MINPRTLAAFFHDLTVAALAWMLAFWLRFNFDTPPEHNSAATYALLWVVPLFAGLFFAFGLYRGLWRFASLSDLQHLVAAVAVGALIVTTVVVLFRVSLIPRSVLVLHPVLLALFMGGSRFAYRSWKEHRLYGPARLRGQPVLVLGAGEAADSLLRELNRSGAWYALALVANDASKGGRRLRGLPVYGSIERIGELAGRYGVKHVIMAMPEARPAERRRVVEVATAAGLAVLTMPSYDDLLTGRLSVSNIRQVELEDLLGRQSVSLDDAGLHQLLADRMVMVSGAGGSIGSELCRQIAHFQPRCLLLYELSEFSLYRIEQELSVAFPDLRLLPLVGDVKDEERLERVFAAHHPEVVFHAAAYKHVPLMENDNAWEAVRNNVFGSWQVAKAAQRHGAGHFVLVSTDKAVNPTNVMGASKRLAERVVQQLQAGEGTRFVIVRFGNVLGSSGSVIPKFREQIAKGGPVTVTHPEIIRYFMLIPEAAQLVLQAGLMGHGGEIYVLEMGEPVRIVDLARDMIRLSGFSEDDIRIEFTGLRPGEKLYEELLADDEQTLPTPHPKLRVAKAREVHDDCWLAELSEWINAGEPQPGAVKLGLQRFVPEYHPQSFVSAAGINMPSIGGRNDSVTFSSLS